MNEIIDPVSHLFQKAQKALPFGEANDFGLETRLRASLSDQNSLFDWVSLFSWRFSATFLPLLIAIVAIYAMRQSWEIPEGAGDLVFRWAGYLLLEI